MKPLHSEAEDPCFSLRGTAKDWMVKGKALGVGSVGARPEEH